MSINTNKRQTGFSLVELLIAMVVMLVLMGITSTVFSRAIGIRSREGRKADALTSAEAALNVMSREIANSGFGIYDGSTANNGIVLADSSNKSIRVLANVDNTGDRTLPAGSTVLAINNPGEDITYFLDATSGSIVRYDPNGGGTGVPSTSIVVNRISDVTFEYYNYTVGSSAFTTTNSPTATTGRIRLTVLVRLDPVQDQPDNQTVTFTSDITLRNASYMLRQY
jgi:prepilin-type N-terminal cleavage/methylation domain-containing protein